MGAAGAGEARAIAANELQPVGQGHHNGDRWPGAVAQRPTSQLGRESHWRGGEGWSRGRAGKRIGEEARGD
jgi:hypothetical protein